MPDQVTRAALAPGEAVDAARLARLGLLRAGEGRVISPLAVFIAADAEGAARPVELGDGCQVGAFAVICGGTRIGDGARLEEHVIAGRPEQTTVRSLSRRAEVESMLATAKAPEPGGVSFFRADLTADAGWAEAVAGADYVVHVASPFPAARPKHEDELIVPARDGALRVLSAARDAGVKRVVLTSSFAAVGYGHDRPGRVFDESDWTDTAGPGVTPYVKSKAVAERAAWDFIAREGKGLELSVVNPVGIFGPVLGPGYSSSIAIIRAMLAGGMRAAPPVWTNVVDVRDAADLHARAMTAPQAAGQRYLALAGEPMSFRQIAAALRARLGDAAAKAPVSTAPAWLIRLMSRFTPPLREMVPQLNVIRRASNAKARSEPGWSPRPDGDAVTATGESLIRLGLLS
jgi:dihydroflavonol-4-reductase